MKDQIRKDVYNKFGGHCAYCGKEIKFKDMQVDHIHPKHLAHFYNHPTAKEEFHLNGESVDAIENLNPSCRRCNHYKRGDNLEGFREKLGTLLERVNRRYIYKVAKDYGMVVEVPFNNKFYFEQLGDNNAK